MWKVAIYFVLVSYGLPVFGEDESFQNGKANLRPPLPKNCIINTTHPNPLNPRTFYHCSGNGLNLLKCPETMVFEAASSACIKDNTPPTKETAKCESQGFFASSDCKKFYRCVDFYNNGEYTIFWFDCPEGLLFDETNNVCNWPFQMQCNPRNDLRLEA